MLVIYFYLFVLCKVMIQLFYSTSKKAYLLSNFTFNSIYYSMRPFYVIISEVYLQFLSEIKKNLHHFFPLDKIEEYYIIIVVRKMTKCQNVWKYKVIYVPVAQWWSIALTVQEVMGSIPRKHI